MNHLSQSIRVAVEKDNPSLERIENKCVKCGKCAALCSNFVSVNNHYDLMKTGKSVCVNCGQCIKECPVGALVGKDEYRQVEALLGDKSKVFVVSTAPSIRVGLGDEFGLPAGSFVEGKMVSLLRSLGFNYVLDTNFGADLTICEEAAELVERIKSGKHLPMFTSCCPSWVKFLETFYPEMKDNLSSCKSPISMFGAVIKTYFANKLGIDPSKIVNVTITPCVAKKFEIRREEFNASAKFNNLPMRDFDFCITTVELAKWAKEKGIDLKSLPDSEFDKFLGKSSGAGVIFGNSGGVMEASVRTAYSYLTKKTPSSLLLNFQEVRGLNEIKTAEIEIANQKLKLAVVSGLANARKLIERIKQGEKFDFVEVMACPGGCIGGGGQPKHIGEEKTYQEKRIASLYERDKQLKVRAAHKNPQIMALYDEFLEGFASERAKALLHTSFVNRSKDLAGKTQKAVKMLQYKCTLCGEVFELDEQKEVICPVCKLKGEKIIKVGERKTD